MRPADVAAIRVLPPAEQGLPRIELQLRARQPVTLEGTVDDDDVKSALLDIVRHTDRYDPGVRLDLLLEEGDKVGDEGEPRRGVEVGQGARRGPQLVRPGAERVVLDFELAHGPTLPQGRGEAHRREPRRRVRVFVYLRPVR